MNIGWLVTEGRSMGAGTLMIESLYNKEMFGSK